MTSKDKPMRDLGFDIEAGNRGPAHWLFQVTKPDAQSRITALKRDDTST